jgi:hypothetical protein
VVTIRADGVDTTLTCTVGVGTTCTDIVHTASVAAGRLLTVRVVTIALETLADLHVSFEY